MRGRLCFLVALLGFLAADARADYQPFVGVTYSHVEYTIGARPVAYDLIDIDPTAPGISFRVTESNGADAGDVNRETTRHYAERVGAQVAINAGFFSPSRDQYVEGDPANIAGLAASDGNIYHAWSSAWAAINIGADNSIHFLDADPGTNAYNAVAGNYRLVTDGVAGDFHGTGDDIPNARSAIAIDSRGHLLLLAVDGRNPSHSFGLTVDELADLLAGPLHAVQAINLDGGGSTTLVMADKGVPRVVNVPVGLGLVPGTERPVATNIAVFAQLRAVPEPSSVALLFVGAASIFVLSRSRRRFGTREG